MAVRATMLQMGLATWVTRGSAGGAWAILVVGCGSVAGTEEGSGTTQTTAEPSSSTATTQGPMATSASETTSTSTASADATGVASTGASSGEVPEPPTCQPLFLHDAEGHPDPLLPSGLVACGGLNAVYREEALACATEHHHPPCPDGDVDDCGTSGACGTGESCVDFFGGGYCGCLAQCNQDSDCQSGQICLCAAGIPKRDGQISWNSINRCVPADCAEDSACGGELRCRVSNDICFQPEALWCTTPADDCQADSDCDTHYCRYDVVEELWTCDSPAVCE